MVRKYLNLLLVQLRTPELRTVPWSVLWLPIILSAIYLITFFMSLFFLATLLDSSFETPEANVLVGASLLSGILMIGFGFQYVSIAVQNAREGKQVKGDVSVWQWLGLETSPDLSLWGAALIGFALAVLIDTVSLVLGVPATSLPLPLDGVSENDSLLFGIAAFTLLVIRPIASGLVFQGVWYPALLKQMPASYAIVASSAIFAILQYLIDPQYVWWGLIAPFVIGVVAGTARAATKSTQMAIVMHMMFSLFIILRAILN